jgi:hypothetical protein
MWRSIFFPRENKKKLTPQHTIEKGEKKGTSIALHSRADAVGQYI